MNPIVKYFLGSWLRHLITIVLTLIVARHYIGADIAAKLMKGDTMTLWNNYTFSISTIVNYVLITLIPTTILPVLMSVWARIKARFKMLTALDVASPQQIAAVLKATPTTEVIRTVAASPTTI